MSVGHSDPVMDLYCVAEALNQMADHNLENNGGLSFVLRLLGEKVDAIACSFDNAGYAVKRKKLDRPGK